MYKKTLFTVFLGKTTTLDRGTLMSIKISRLAKIPTIYRDSLRPLN